MNLRPPGYEQNRASAKGRESPRKSGNWPSTPPTSGRPALKTHIQKALPHFPTASTPHGKSPPLAGNPQKQRGANGEIEDPKRQAKGGQKGKTSSKTPKPHAKSKGGGKKENRTFFVKIPNRKGKKKRQSKMPSGSQHSQRAFALLLTHSSDQLSQSLHLVLGKAAHVKVGSGCVFLSQKIVGAALVKIG